jgi:hypothetical protein
MHKYFKGLSKYLAFGLTWELPHATPDNHWSDVGLPHAVPDNSLVVMDTKLDAQITYAHSPKVISRTKGVNAHQCKCGWLIRPE